MTNYFRESESTRQDDASETLDLKKKKSMDFLTPQKKISNSIDSTCTPNSKFSLT